MKNTAPPSSSLRLRAQEQAARFPPLLAEAQQLATSVVMGTHGRRQAGAGAEFWQFRNALPGDEWRGIDWRRSARSDAHYIRQQEWQAAQSVLFWIDQASSMRFTGAATQPPKAARAVVLGLAAMILLLRGGERVGLLDDIDPPRAGNNQLERVLAQLDVETATDADYGTPVKTMLPKGSQAVFLSDFLGDIDPLSEALANAAERGVRGALVQILDPQEELFPFDGRTEFQSMAGTLRFETLRARGLRAAYLARLAERKDRLQALCKRSGWQYLCHHTNDTAQGALMWLYSALEHGRAA